MGANGKPKSPDIPALEWIAAGVGLLLTLAVLGAMVWQAVRGGGEPPPAIEVRAERVVATPAGFAAELVLDNRAPTTAAGVEVQGELRSGSRVVETTAVTIDYVPGASTRRAGLFFRNDPRAHQLEVRVLGYAEP